MKSLKLFCFFVFLFLPYQIFPFEVTSLKILNGDKVSVNDLIKFTCYFSGKKITNGDQSTMLTRDLEIRYQVKLMRDDLIFDNEISSYEYLMTDENVYDNRKFYN